MHANTRLDEETVRLEWMGKSVADFKASNDPYIQYAVAMYDADMKMEKEEEELAGKLQQARPAYMNAMIAFKQSKGEAVYADANSSLRITGGNSGSATLNGKGEFVGLVFDGVYESIIGDWDYDPKLNRAIHTSVPYMLWVMEHIDGAHSLLKEMTIVK